ncbi:MAG TPA: MFS transporter [Acidimicrobiales bacterium]|nr:MFS transporter [Acidimicrobiales bacterium]
MNDAPAHRSIVAGGTVALVVLAFNLRTAIAAVAPVLGQIQSRDHLSAAEGGLLTTVPVICFGLFALVTPALIRAAGLDRLLALTLVGLLAGMLVRLAPGPATLFAGTTLIGASIGVTNVALPALVKRDHPTRVAEMTGLYALCLSAGAALAAGVTVPAERAAGVGWAPALGLWVVPVAVALVVWGPAFRRRAPVAPSASPPVRGLWRDRRAWAVTGFMGLQSLSYYATLTWVPTILVHAGIGSGAAGALLSLSAVASLVTSLGAPLLARWSPRTWAPIVGAVGLCAVAYAGLALDPAGLAPVWMVALGSGQGACLALALGVIGLRSPTSHHAGHLSTMAQGTGYLVAAVGPVGLGALHQLVGGWAVPLGVLGVFLLPQLLAGVLASRPGHVLAAEGR